MTITNTISEYTISSQVKLALEEDIGQHDITADLIQPATIASAIIISREAATLCGQAWLDEVFKQIDPNIKIIWHFNDGDILSSGNILCELSGPARSLLMGERTAMNYIQTLSATATISHDYVKKVEGFNVQILDTRKTIPGLRLAQKYAVRCGGCFNHRIGLYDGILIKENHINASGSINAAIILARSLHPTLPIEVEVENLEELGEALIGQADIIMLDNFDSKTLKQAVALNQGQAILEASGNVNLNSIRTIAESGVDRISVGALTKDIKAIDFSMRFI